MSEAYLKGPWDQTPCSRRGSSGQRAVSHSYDGDLSMGKTLRLPPVTAHRSHTGLRASQRTLSSLYRYTEHWRGQYRQGQARPSSVLRPQSRAECALRAAVADTRCHAHTRRHPNFRSAVVAQLVRASLSNTPSGEKFAHSCVGLAPPAPAAARGDPRCPCAQTTDPVLYLPIPKASVRPELPASR